MVAVRGPKPTGELECAPGAHRRTGPPPFTTDDVVRSLAGIATGLDCAVGAARYGATNQARSDALEARGAIVREIVMHAGAARRYSAPKDLLDALAASRVDAVVYQRGSSPESICRRGAEQGRSESLVGLMDGPRGRTDRACLLAGAALLAGSLRLLEASPPKLGSAACALEVGVERSLGGDASCADGTSLRANDGAGAIALRCLSIAPAGESDAVAPAILLGKI